MYTYSVDKSRIECDLYLMTVIPNTSAFVTITSWLLVRINDGVQTIKCKTQGHRDIFFSPSFFLSLCIYVSLFLYIHCCTLYSQQTYRKGKETTYSTKTMPLPKSKAVTSKLCRGLRTMIVYIYIWYRTTVYSIQHDINLNISSVVCLIFVGTVRMARSALGIQAKCGEASWVGQGPFWWWIRCKGLHHLISLQEAL